MFWRAFDYCVSLRWATDRLVDACYIVLMLAVFASLVAALFFS